MSDSWSLTVGEVQCWTLNLALDEPPADAQRLLSADEQARAARYKFDSDRNRFLHVRTTLRSLLGRYTGQAPEQLQFEFNEHKKPCLPKSDSAVDVRFNVSHSGSTALLAFAAGVDLGVDVEFHRELSDMLSVANWCLSEEQFADFESITPLAEQRQAFFRFWTRKEALIKAIGKGLAQPLKEFDVTFRSDQPPGLLRAGQSFGEIANWQLCDITVAGPYHACLAMPTRTIRLVTRQFDIHD